MGPENGRLPSMLQDPDWRRSVSELCPFKFERRELVQSRFPLSIGWWPADPASFTCKISLFMGSGLLTNYLACLLLVFLSCPRRRLLVSFVVLLRKSPERLIMAGKVVGVPFHVDHAHAYSFTRKEFRLM